MYQNIGMLEPKQESRYEQSRRLFKEQMLTEFIQNYFRHKTKDQIYEERVLAQRKKDSKQRIKKNIKTKSLDMFVTFTLNDSQDRTTEGLQSVQRRLKYAFDKLDIEYCLRPEFHDDSTSIHFHGFVRLNDKTLLEPKIYKEGSKKGQRVHDFGCPIYEVKYLEDNFGYSRLQFLTEDAIKIQKQVNYMLKYTSKSNDFNLMTSRPKTKKKVLYQKVIALFGSNLVRFED